MIYNNSQLAIYLLKLTFLPPSWKKHQLLSRKEGLLLCQMSVDEELYQGKKD